MEDIIRNLGNSTDTDFGHFPIGRRIINKTPTVLGTLAFLWMLFLKSTNLMDLDKFMDIITVISDPAAV